MQMVSLFSDVFKCSFTTKCQSLAKFKAMRMFSLCFAKRKHFNEHWQSNSSKTHHAQNYWRKHARFVLGTERLWHFPKNMTSADIRVLCSVLEPFWKSAISIEQEHRLWSRKPWINQMFVFVKLPIETETFNLNTWEIAEDYVFLVYARRMALLSVSFRQDNASAIATIWYSGYSKVPKSRRLFIGRLHVSIEEGEDALEELVQRNRCGDFLLNSVTSGSLSWWSWWTW